MQLHNYNYLRYFCNSIRLLWQVAIFQLQKKNTPTGFAFIAQNTLAQELHQKASTNPQNALPCCYSAIWTNIVFFACGPSSVLFSMCVVANLCQKVNFAIEEILQIHHQRQQHITAWKVEFHVRFSIFSK